MLPIDLLSFNGNLQSNLSTLLKWKTTDKINTDRREIGRGIDKNNFKQIGNTKEAGNNNGELKYSYIDNEAKDQQSKTVFYRLKLINIDGSFKYSSVIKILLPNIKASITIAPNPAINDVKGNILSSIAEKVTFTIFDNAGRKVLQTTKFIKKGNNNFSENINQLASGACYLNINGNNILSRIKFQNL